MNNKPLVIAGALSIFAAVVHLAIIAGGPDWYRFFGAGEQMAVMAEQGQLYPAIVTLFIAAMLFLWGLYALSGARVIPRLPLLRFCLMAITFIYLLRGIGGLVVAFMPQVLQQVQLSSPFMLWSSAICTLFGVTYLVGIYRGWANLAQKTV